MTALDCLGSFVRKTIKDMNKLQQPEMVRSKTLWRLLFLCVPTIIFVFFMLKAADSYYALLSSQYLVQSVYFAAGILISCTLFSYRLRFIPITLLIILLLYVAHSILDSISIGEFDSFFLSVRFRIFTILFLFGWLCGWGFARLRYFTVLLSALLLLLNLIFVSHTVDIKFEALLLSFAPTLLFSFYIIYMAESIRSMSSERKHKWWHLSKRLIAFAVLIALLFSLSALLLTSSFRKVEKEWGGASQSDENGLLSKNPDSTVNIKQSLRVSQNFNSGKSNPMPVFVAYLDSFIEGANGDMIPNPLYFTMYYLPKFDTYTETFERDTLVPYDDLFKPDPSKIPLYFTEIDSTVLKNGMSTEHRSVVTTEVYKIQLSPDEFAAPTTSFFCQPISVERDFKDQFKSAYRAKMYVSDFNSAYFVYPSRDLMLQQFQLYRFEMLSKVKDFSSLPQDFYEYYTLMPKGSYFDSIQQLANRITASAETPADKILAIRDYFMSMDDYGKPLFKYSENPGIPGIPSASKLADFLFRSHTGYCAHYAGASLFLIRACGIPARVTVGFATVDRSTKNPGWYWFYEDQAHAWVQVFFPDYGWLDFDFTIGNEQMEEAPTSDGTPPMQPQKAYFAGRGMVEAVDTLKQLLTFSLKKMVYHDKEYVLNRPERLQLDMRVASIEKDSVKLRLSQVVAGDSALAISFAELLKELPPRENQSAEQIVEMMPRPVPIDELHIDGKEQKKLAEFFKQDDKKPTKYLSIGELALILIVAIAVLLLELLLTPYVMFRYYRARALSKKAKIESKAYYSYRTAMFLLNQLGCTRGELTPLQYAQEKVDANYDTAFAPFMVVYLKLKYANQTLNEQEQQRVSEFYRDFEPKVKAKHPFGFRFRKFLNFYTAMVNNG